MASILLCFSKGGGYMSQNEFIELFLQASEEVQAQIIELLGEEECTTTQN